MSTSTATELDLVQLAADGIMAKVDKALASDNPRKAVAILLTSTMRRTAAEVGSTRRYTQLSDELTKVVRHIGRME